VILPGRAPYAFAPPAQFQEHRADVLALRLECSLDLRHREIAVDLGRIDMPSYVLATQEDHIVPWRSAYRTTQLVRGRSQFVLGACGHIAGVINPASKNKRSYWVDGGEGDDAEKWLVSASEVPGSWWRLWIAWLAPMAQEKVAARSALGDHDHPMIEPAPGRYVKAKAN